MYCYVHQQIVYLMEVFAIWCVCYERFQTIASKTHRTDICAKTWRGINLLWCNLLGRHGSVSLCRDERENKMAATYNVLAFKR